MIKKIITRQKVKNFFYKKVMIKKNITRQKVKNFFYKKVMIAKNLNSENFSDNSFRTIFGTLVGSFLLVSFFFIVPLIIEFKDNNINISKEIKNESKSNFEKILEGESLGTSSNIDEALDSKNLFEDISKFEILPTDVVRLNAPTIEQLFKETDYNLKDVRKNKLVKPISLSLLPKEMKMIESTKKKKDLFIRIILPLIIEENNRIKFNRKKLFSILNKNNNTNEEKKWLNQKFKRYGVINRDVSTLKVRMDIIPVSLAIAQAAKETGWGTSRFAIEGNALFGQWTWSGEGIKPAGADDDTTHKVMKFRVLQASVRAYQRNLNTHSSYKEFRMARAVLRDRTGTIDSLVLAKYLNRYAETGEQYVKILKKIITQNNLTDFDDVKLQPSSIQLKSLI